MMKRFLSVFFLILIFAQIDAYAQSAQKSSVRSIKFIDLKEPANAPFFSYYREIPRLIMTAIQSGSIKPFVIEYDNKSTVIPLSLTAYNQRIGVTLPLDTSMAYFFGINYLFPSDLPYVGLDQTISIADGKECTHVHYVNFYSHENFSEDKKIRQYRFSVTWEDFIMVLKKRTDLLYSPNTFGAWWRGNIFLTNERYFLETPTADFIELSRNKNVLPKSFDGQHYMKTVDSLNKKMYAPSMMDIYFIEERYKDEWKIKQIAFGTLPEQQSYEKEVRFLYNWSDFTDVLKKEQSSEANNIYTLADAFLLKKFQYSDKIQAVQVMKNDTLENSDLFKESFAINKQPIKDKKLHTQLLENIYLEDTCNKQLNIAGHSLSEIIYTYALDGALPVYENDSLKSVISNSEFRYNASQYLDVAEIFDDGMYEKGDTVSMNVYIEKNNSYETHYFIVQENFNGINVYMDSTFLTKVAMRYYPPLYQLSALNVVELYQHLIFDIEGNNKKYKLQAIALHVSADAPTNVRGIQYPICFVRWDDLKTLLLKDPKAYFMYKNKKANLVELLENRAFLSSFYKTGYVERGK